MRFARAVLTSLALWRFYFLLTQSWIAKLLFSLKPLFHGDLSQSCRALLNWITFGKGLRLHCEIMIVSHNVSNVCLACQYLSCIDMENSASVQAMLADICLGNCGHFDETQLISTQCPTGLQKESDRVTSVHKEGLLKLGRYETK